MTTVDKATLTEKLRASLNRSFVDVLPQVDSVLASALSTNSLNDINIITVSTKFDLPNLSLYDSPGGMLYFILDIGVFAISSGDKWLTLDGRLLRQDTSHSLRYSWGSNSYGQLGHGTDTTCSRSSPVIVVGGFTDWCQVSAGCAHSLGIRTNGTAWSWGANGNGRLGDNSTINRSSPVSVVGGFTDWCQVSAGCAHSLGLRTNGTAWDWGRNDFGQLGDNSVTTRTSPVSVVGGFTDLCQVSAGCAHSLGLRTNGTAWSWGANGVGQLGHGTGSACSRSSPVSVVGGFTDWCQVSAGGLHSLGLRTDGTAWSWGDNSSGQLGHGTGSACCRSSPVSVVGGFADWCQVSAGNSHSLGLRTNGTAWGWGSRGLFGLLGDGIALITSNSPVSVIGGFTDWCQVSAGCDHSLGLRTNGTAWGWGSNNSGRLGTDEFAIGSPISVVGGFTDWCRVSAGGLHSLGIRVIC